MTGMNMFNTWKTLATMAILVGMGGLALHDWRLLANSGMYAILAHAAAIMACRERK
jgi:hypothetical protein